MGLKRNHTCTSESIIQTVLTPPCLLLIANLTIEKTTCSRHLNLFHARVRAIIRVYSSIHLQIVALLYTWWFYSFSKSVMSCACSIGVSLNVHVKCVWKPLQEFLRQNTTNTPQLPERPGWSGIGTLIQIDGWKHERPVVSEMGSQTSKTRSNQWLPCRYISDLQYSCRHWHRDYGLHFLGNL